MNFDSLTFRYWVEFCFGVLTTLMTTGFIWIWKRFRKSQQEQESIRNGIKALLRDRIIQAYNYYKDKGFCPIYGLENVHSMFQEYETLGGNGTVKRLVEELASMPRTRQRGQQDKGENV